MLALCQLFWASIALPVVAETSLFVNSIPAGKWIPPGVDLRSYQVFSQLLAELRSTHRAVHSASSSHWSTKCTDCTRLRRYASDQEVRCPTKKGDWVRFLASEVFLSSQEVLASTHASLNEMEGVIVDFSDSGTRPRAFAVVKLATGQTIIVPVEKMKMARPGSSGEKK